MGKTDKCETHKRLDGKVAVVTGATSGVGLEVAKDLARRGARVIIASRNPSKLKNARKIIIKSAGHRNVAAKYMDFESLSSIRKFSYDTLATEPRLDILVNNIGAIGLKDAYTEDGLQKMMQVNYFGTFLLTFLLFPLLKRSAPSRIVNVASFMAFMGKLDLEHFNDAGRYPNFGYYSNAKLAEVMMTIEMDKRIKGTGVSIYSLDPGLIKSKFYRNFDNDIFKNTLNTMLQAFGRPPEVGAKTAIYLAVNPAVKHSSGKNFKDCVENYTFWFAKNPTLARKLWELSKLLVRISPEEDWEYEGQGYGEQG